MATTQYKIAGLYAAFFNRAPDQVGFDMWVDKLNAGTHDLNDIAAGFAEHNTFTDLYGSMNTQAFVEAIYMNMLGNAGDTAGIANQVAALEDGTYATRADFIAGFITSVLEIDLTDSIWDSLTPQERADAQARQDLMNNKIAVSIDFMEKLGASTNVVDAANPEADPAYLASINILSGVTADPASVTTATNLITALATDPSIAIATINEIKETHGSITDDSSVIDNAQNAVNTAPVLSALTPVAYAENVTIPAGTVVATAAATDADGQTLTYALAEGSDARFTINATTGAISVVANTTFDYETETSVSLTVTATDGLSTVSTPLAINVTNEAASYTLVPDAATAKDGDTVSFTFTATESTATELTYTITGVDAADVVGGAAALSGTATIVGGEAVVSVTLLADRADAVVETMTASAVVAGQTVTATTSVATSVATNVTVSTTEITIAQNASEYITKEAGDTGLVNYTINSQSAAGLDAEIVIGGNANINVTSGTGADTIIIDGTGNNVINAGDGADKIYLNAGNDVVVIGTTGHFDVGSIIDGGEGVNTIRVSGTNDLTVKTVVVGAGNDTIASAQISNIQNLIIEDGARVTISKDFLSTLSHVTVLGTTAQLTITGESGSTVETIDLTNVLTGTLGKLTVGITLTDSDGANDVSIYLTEAQINNITTFAKEGASKIMSTPEGAELLVAKGITPSVDGGEADLKSATAQNLASVANLEYEVNVSASEAFDQLYLGVTADSNGLAADQLQDSGATTNITTTATVAQAVIIDANATIGTTFAVADTAANIASTMNATGNTSGWLTATNITSLTIQGGASVADAKKIFHASGDLKAAVAAAALDEEDNSVITLPTYTISDTATNIAANYSDASVTNATSVAVTTGAFTVAEANTIKTALGAKLTNYSITDTAANLYSMSQSLRDGATDITVSAKEVFELDLHDSLAVVGADTVTFDGTTVTLTDSTVEADVATALAAATYTNWTAAIKSGTTDVVVFTAKIAGAKTDVTVGAPASASVIQFSDVAGASTSLTGVVTVTTQGGSTAATVLQAERLENFNNAGTTTYSISDTANALSGASTTVLSNAQAVTVTTAATVAQATKFASYLADNAAWTLSDTGANLVSDAAKAFYAEFPNMVVTPSAAITLAQSVELKAINATQIGTLTAHAISDTAAAIIDATNDQAGDVLGNLVADIASTTAAKAALAAATAVTLTEATSAANVKAIDALTTAAVAYSLTDSATNIVADAATAVNGGAAGTLVGSAASIALQSSASALEAVTLKAISDARVGASKSAVSYSITDSLTDMATQVSGGNTSALTAASTITIEANGGTVTVADAYHVKTLNTALTGANKATLTYSISDDATAFLALDDGDADADAAALALMDAAATVTLVDTLAGIDSVKGSLTASVIAIAARVDSYAILDDIDNITSGNITTYATYLDNATSITLTDANDSGITLAEATEAYKLLLADSNASKVSYAIVAGKAGLLAANTTGAVTGDVADSTTSYTAAEKTGALSKASALTVSDATVSVAEFTSIDALTAGTIKLTGALTDTAANLLSSAAALSAVKAGAGTVAVSGAITTAEYETLLDMMETAALLRRDATTNNLETPADGAVATVLTVLGIADSITAVQSASTDLLKSLTDNNDITLTAGSEISLTLAEAGMIASGAVESSDGSTDATYEIVDTITNLVDAIADNAGSATAIMTAATTIIATSGVVIPELDADGAGPGTDTYIDFLETLVSSSNFDKVNSVYSLSGEAATLATTDADQAVKYATSVTVTDAATIAQATTILGYSNNDAVTFTSIEDDYTNIFTITNGVAAYANTTVASIISKANAVDLVDGTPTVLTVAQAQAITTLLGDKTVTYTLADTAANLAAAGDLLANATTLTATDAAGTQLSDESKVSVAQATAIITGATHVDSNGDSDVTFAPAIVDTAANLAAASQSVFDKAASVTVSGRATIAEAVSIVAKDAAQSGGSLSITINVVDSAATVLTNKASTSDVTASLNGGTIALNGTVTLAQAKSLDAAGLGAIRTLDTVITPTSTSTSSTAGVVVSDTAANLLAASKAAGYSDALKVIVTDAINVSKAVQIYDAFAANDDNGQAAYSAMTYNISDAQAYIVRAFEEDNAVIGNATSITVEGVGAVEVAQLAGTYYLTGSVAELSALPAALLEVGYIVNDTIANLTADASVEFVSGANAQSYIITDEAANILAVPSYATAASSVNVTNAITTTTLAELQSTLGNKLSTVSALSGTVANLTAAALDDQVISTITVSDASITLAQYTAAFVTGETLTASTTLVYNLNDTETSIFGADDAFETNALAAITNATAVTITENLNVTQAGLVYDANGAAVFAIADASGAFDVLLEASYNIDATEQAQIDALNAATTVALTAGQTVEVDQAVALKTLTGFNNVYTLSDTATLLAAADATVLSGAASIQLSGGNATVAEATVLSVLSNFKKLAETGADAVYKAMTIEDTATALANASAGLLDNVKTISISAAAHANEVTAADATKLKALIDNTTVVGLDTSDNYVVVDTFENITATANAAAVNYASTISVTGNISLANAQAVIAVGNPSAGNVTATTFLYNLSGTYAQLTQATNTEAGYAVIVTVTDDIAATQAAVVNELYNSGGRVATVTFGKVTGTSAELTSSIVAQATTVDVTDAMTVAELSNNAGTGFLDYASAKLVGGYVVEDSVANIVNAALNNDFSNAVVADATSVTLLSGEETMNIAASSVIIGLGNFGGNYNITDTSTAIAGASASIINGAALTTVNLVDGTKDTFDASAYTSAVVINADGATSDADIVTLAAATNKAAVKQTIDLNDNTAIDVGFTLDFGYITGQGWTSNNAAAQAVKVSDGTDTVYVSSLTNFKVEDTYVIIGTSGNDTIITGEGTGKFGLVTGETAIVFAGAGNDAITLSAATETVMFSSTATANGFDTITGFVLATDIIDLSTFTDSVVAVAADAAIVADATDKAAYVFADGSDGTGAQAIADYTDLTDVAAFLNAGLTSAEAETYAAVINDLANDKAYIYYIDVDADTTVDNRIDAGDLTLVGVVSITTNAPITTTEVVG